MKNGSKMGKRGLFLALLPLVLSGCGSSGNSLQEQEKRVMDEFASNILRYHSRVYTIPTPLPTMVGCYGHDFVSSEKTDYDYAFFCYAQTPSTLGTDTYFFDYFVKDSETYDATFYAVSLKGVIEEGDEVTRTLYYYYLAKADISVPDTISHYYFQSLFLHQKTSSSDSSSSRSSSSRSSSATISSSPKPVSIPDVLDTSLDLGRYPQTVVEDLTLIDSLSSAADTDSDGYLEYGGEEYKKVISAPYASGYQSASGSTTFIKGAPYYFKVEPIEWRVLSGKSETTGLVLSEKILDKGICYTSRDDRMVSGSTVYANNYKYSTLRAALNGYDGSSYFVDNFTGNGFLDVAFSEAEKAYITTTAVDNSAATTESSTNGYACANTGDKIFALSYQDLLNTSYGFDVSSNPDTARQGSLTDYARATGAWMSTGTSSYGNGCWWLRSPNADYAYNARIVGGDGYLNYSGVGDASNGIRPSFTINLH